MSSKSKHNDIPSYTKHDYLETMEPYEYLYAFKDNVFELEKKKTKMSELAREQGVKNFATLYSKYVKEQKKVTRLSSDNITQFEDQEMELNCGDWKADDFGVTINMANSEVVACVHPIMPVMRLVNIDTGVEKLKIAYRKGDQWRSVIADKRTLASSNAIIQLADVGIAVNSENSKYLVKYLHDLENYNYDIIPEKKSVSRLGWIEGQGFSPYVQDLVFDGDVNFKAFFESVQESGDYKKWLETAKAVRQKNVQARIILASSFASVLVKPMHALPFFVHLWGGTETGKTVGLMLAASVWADPQVGHYVHTFSSTSVGREKSAAFVNSLPLILDELQIARNKKEFDDDIYQLSEGAGRTRGNKGGGVDRIHTWANCILTSGETPITSFSSGGGAVNRIVEIECAEKLFEDPKEVVNVIKENYGYAGKMFLKELQSDGNIEFAREMFKIFYSELSNKDTTEKQAAAAALILTADFLATAWVFKDERFLSVSDVAPFLQTKEAVSVNQRAYEYICEYVIRNIHMFDEKNLGREVWGKIEEGNLVCITNNTYNTICAEAGFNGKALKSWLKQTGKLVYDKDDRLTKKTYINKHRPNCVAIKMDEYEENIQAVDVDLTGIFPVTSKETQQTLLDVPEKNSLGTNTGTIKTALQSHS